MKVLACNAMFLLAMAITLSDIDECSEQSDDCVQNCKNVIGSYVCGCDEGYSLNDDGHSCDGKPFST